MWMFYTDVPCTAPMMDTLIDAGVCLCVCVHVGGCGCECGCACGCGCGFECSMHHPCDGHLD